MKMKWNLLLVLVSILTVTACSKKKSGLENMIPADAKIVVAINAQQLMNKMATSGLSTDSFPKAFLKAAMDSTILPAKTFSKEAEETGIDFAQPIYMAASFPQKINEKNGVIRVLAAIKDKDKLTAFFKKVKATVTESNGLSFAAMDDFIVGFDKNYLVFAKDVPSNMLNNKYNYNTTEADATTAVKPLTEDQIKAEIKATFSSNTKSITTNKNYNRLPMASNDVKVWMDMEFYYANMPQQNESLQMVTTYLKDLYAGGSTTSLLNFENGKISAKSQVYLNDEVSALIAKTPSKKLDFSLINNFGAKKVDVLVGMAIDPNMILDFVKYLKQDGILNIALGKMQLTNEDVFGAISGDAMLVAADLNDTDLTTETAKDANLGIIIKLKDKAKFEKLLAQPMVAANLVLENGLYTMKKGTENIVYMAITNDVAIISPNKVVVTNYTAGTNKLTLDASISAALTGKTGGYYADIASMVKAFSKQKGEGNQMGTIANNVASMFTNTYLTGEPFKDNCFESNGYLNLNNNSQNSLGYMVKEGTKIANFFLNFTKNTDGMDEASKYEQMDDTVKPMQVK